jgi:hypothetical protein
MMFPGAGAQVYRNEEGEPVGWDYPDENEGIEYCEWCGFSHYSGSCPDDGYDDE